MIDQDAIIAGADLVGRSGARQFEIGYLYDETDPQYAKVGAQWYAHAQYRGARIVAENHPDPVAAVEALAQKLLTGAKCDCGKLVALNDGWAFAYFNTPMRDGTTWTAEEALAVGQCRWRREGARWKRGCE